MTLFVFRQYFAQSLQKGSNVPKTCRMCLVQGLVQETAPYYLEELLVIDSRDQAVSHPSSFPHSVTEVTAQVCKKSNTHIVAPPCLSGHCSSFCFLGGSLHTSGNLAPLTGSRQTKPVLPVLPPRRPEDHP